jgi:hypothetical protein
MNPEEALDLLDPDYQLGFFVANRIQPPTLSIDTCHSQNMITILYGERKKYERLQNVWHSLFSTAKSNAKADEAFEELTAYRDTLYDKYLPEEWIVALPMIKVNNLEQFKQGIIAYLWGEDNCNYSLNQEDIEFVLEPAMNHSTIKLVRKKLKTESGS